MAAFDREASKPHNLDHTPSLGLTKLAGEVSGGADERRRRTGRSGQRAIMAGTRACQHASDPHLITTKICGVLQVDEEKDFNGSD